jgi:hypothetical protein
MLSSNIRKEFLRSTSSVRAGSPYQKARVTFDMINRDFVRTGRIPIVHSKDAKVILRKKS